MWIQSLRYSLARAKAAKAPKTWPKSAKKINLYSILRPGIEPLNGQSAHGESHEDVALNLRDLQRLQIQQVECEAD